MPFQFQRLDIPDVLLIEPQIFKDPRGFFMETYKKSDFVANGISEEFVQSNYSNSIRGTLRGMHFQKHPQTQGKLLMVVRGEVFDVAVDIRKGSPTYGRWIGVTLSDTNHRMLYVPVGFAHGFCVLSEEAGLFYHVTAEFAQELEHGIRWDDPAIGIEWPISAPLLSKRDTQLPLLQEAGVDFTYKG